MYYTERTPNFPPSCTPHTSSISHSLFSILTCYTLPSAHAYKHITHPSSSLAKRIIVHGGIVSGPKTFARAPRGGLFRPTYRCPRGGYKASTSRVYIYINPLDGRITGLSACASYTCTYVYNRARVPCTQVADGISSRATRICIYTCARGFPFFCVCMMGEEEGFMGPLRRGGSRRRIGVCV